MTITETAPVHTLLPAFFAIDPDTLRLSDTAEYSDRAPALVISLTHGHAYLTWTDTFAGCLSDEIWHRRAVQLTLPGQLPEDLVNVLAYIAPLVERILAGGTVRWNGTADVGEFTADADAAANDLGWAALSGFAPAAGRRVIVEDSLGVAPRDIAEDIADAGFELATVRRPDLLAYARGLSRANCDGEHIWRYDDERTIYLLRLSDYFAELWGAVVAWQWSGFDAA